MNSTFGKNKGTTFYCFSPPVMVATLIIEVSLVIYTVWRYRLNQTSRLVLALLIMLATFQYSEYNVCTGFGIKAEDWSRLGYIAISALPILGIHLLHILAGKKSRKVIVAGYINFFIYLVYFLTYRAAFIGYKCTGNYVIFQMADTSSYLYGLYYYFWLLATIFLAVSWIKGLKNQKTKKSKNIRDLLEAMILGYLIFLVPTSIANSVSPSTRNGIPSIMCGFAVLFAFILVGYILPNTTKENDHKRIIIGFNKSNNLR